MDAPDVDDAAVDVDDESPLESLPEVADLSPEPALSLELDDSAEDSAPDLAAFADFFVFDFSRESVL